MIGFTAEIGDPEGRVANPCAEIVCAMIETAVSHYRRFADMGVVDGWRIVMEKWPREFANPIGGMSKEAAVEVASVIQFDGMRWYPGDVRETVLDFLREDGGMDHLIDACGLELNGDAVRRGLSLRPAMANRNFAGVKRAERLRTVGVLGMNPVQIGRRDR